MIIRQQHPRHTLENMLPRWKWKGLVYSSSHALRGKTTMSNAPNILPTIIPIRFLISAIFRPSDEFTPQNLSSCNATDLRKRDR